VPDDHGLRRRLDRRGGLLAQRTGFGRGFFHGGTDRLQVAAQVLQVLQHVGQEQVALRAVLRSQLLDPRGHGFQLTWHHAGRVWARDFTQPLHPIDGTFPYVLAIRDLASHYQLAWCPVRGETADDVQPVLRALFAEHGPALVLKNDNGSGFIAASTQDTLSTAGVIQLLSPPARPQYNGALERSNGVLKTYTHQHAQSAGHPFRWTSDDLEHARRLANTMSRPWGADGPSPEQAWNQRSPITDDQRQTFALALTERRAWAAEELGLDLAADLDRSDRARLDRLALSQTLQDLGYLTMKRVRRPPKKPKRLTREQLKRRTARFRKQGDNATPGPENSARPQPPERPVAAAENFGAQVLAPAPPDGTMQVPVGALPLSPDARPAESAHRERANDSWFRRHITPLISIWKTANIPR
jgi:transposase InsO family protein